MPKLYYRAVLEAASDGYCVFFPDFDGCTSWGANLTDAASNATDALALHLQGWAGPLPEPSALNAPIDPEAEPTGVVLVPLEMAAERYLAHA